MNLYSIVKHNLKTLLFGSVFIFFIGHTTAQVQQSWEVGGFIGLSNYKGDLAPSLKLSNILYNAGAEVKYNVDYFSGFRMKLTSLSINAKDKRVDFPMYDLRQASFSANMIEAAFLYDYNFIPFMHPKQLKNWSPYLTGGLAIYNANIKGNDVENLQPNSIGVVIPMGVGSRIALNPKWIINFEFLSRKTFTDKLDLTSNAYSNGKQRGVYSNNDWYHTLNVGISYTFYSVKCPSDYPEQ